MIICVSANPAIDRRLRVKTLTPGAVNRAISVETFAGGKAAHVAMAARALGEEVVWVGFVGGHRGDELRRQLADIGIRVVAVSTGVETRTNDEIIDAEGSVTEILEPGGPIAEDELAEFLVASRQQMAASRTAFQLVLSGSLPRNVPSDLYAQLIISARELGGQIIVDTSGEALTNVLAAGPDLVKPNLQEAQVATGMSIDGPEKSVKLARNLVSRGAGTAAISLGRDGMVWTDGDRSLFAKAPIVDVVSTVGCGDSTVAGFAVAAARKLDVIESVRLAVACGTANCLAEMPGRINIDEVKGLLPLVTVNEVSNAAKGASEVI